MANKQMLLAKAVYDNIAETPDELAFKRGDVVTVIELNTGGLEGWWLCTFRGKQGIAPGNRLKLLTQPPNNSNHLGTQEKSQDSINPSTPDWNRRSWDVTPNKVLTPEKYGDVYIDDHPNRTGQDYDVPRSQYLPNNISNNSLSMSGASSQYSLPTSNRSSREDLLNHSSSFDQSVYNTPPQIRNNSVISSESMYDTPPSRVIPVTPNTLDVSLYDHPASNSPRTSLSSKHSEDSLTSLSSGISNTRSNPNSICDSARSSLDISPMDLYDVPPPQRELRGAILSQASKDSGLDLYDSPPKAKQFNSSVEDYDVPKERVHNTEGRVVNSSANGHQVPHSEPSSPGGFLEDYDIPKHSFLDRRKLPGGLYSGSEPPSPGSNLDDYDVPRSRILVKDNSHGDRNTRHKSPSVGSLLDDYDVPRSDSNTSVNKSQSVENMLDDYDVPRSNTGTLVKKAHSFDNVLDTYDVPRTDTLKKNKSYSVEHMYDDPSNVLSGSKSASNSASQEHAVDDLYDTPKNNAPVENMTKVFSSLAKEEDKKPTGVYDIPPQVTRDSVISAKSDSSEGTDSRLSNSSLDSRNSDIPIYDELPLDLDAAMDLVIKLQQDVQKSTTKLCAHVNSSWRRKDPLEQKLYEIKESCHGVKNSLEDFVELAQGTLANSAKLPDRKLINKLSKHLAPLQQSLNLVRSSLKNLDDMSWQLVRLVTSDASKKDDLGQIVALSKDLTPDVRKLASIIQGNSTLLFKRAQDLNQSGILAKDNGKGNLKPPIMPKPNVAAKPFLTLPGKDSSSSSSVQQRPLPPPPVTDRPLPPTPTEKKSQSFVPGDQKRLSGEVKRMSGDFKHWSGEFHVRRFSRDSNRSTPERDSVDSGKCNSDDIHQEYDYVQLDDEKSDSQKPEKKLDSSQPTLPEKKGGVKPIYDQITCTNVIDTKLTVDTVDTNEYLKDVDEVDGQTENVNAAKIEDMKKTVTIEQDVDVVPERDTTPAPAKLFNVDSNDKQVLVFYSEQMKTHSTLLNNAVDAFFTCIESNEPPKVFISNSKFVVVSAHKLVYICDSLYKNLAHDEIRNRINDSANHLCDCLKLTVTTTKTAALQYPSVPAMQEMVNSVTGVSHAAHQLKLIILQASSL
ncbi:hypothetical protein CHS0354_009399 [Potamilus streckersoni]|uniref:Breast cancer anti-estrogen resistance protein 1 n=1 Tax=Potamilus streckersoni TaxID=2493646 RepID=A0AAE0W712_9BIVA|nr:hypothetical protein CHS0354_009399 [Potamilus streckersoni]